MPDFKTLIQNQKEIMAKLKNQNKFIAKLG